MEHLRGRLEEVAGSHFDTDANLETIVALIGDQGCDLEADILPIVARELPELPHRRTPAIEWDEFVGGYRAGLIEMASAAGSTWPCAASAHSEILPFRRVSSQVSSRAA
jgi:hypothetical protein